MSSIGSLAATVTANAEPFLNKMKQIQGSAASTAKGIAGAFNNLSGGSLLGPLAGGLSVTGIAAMAKEGIDHLHELNKKSKQFGMSIGDMRGFEQAAGGDLDAVTPGLIRIQKLLGEVSLGSKEAAKGFEALGLNAKELSQLPLDKVIGLIGDKLKGYSASGKIAIAGELIPAKQLAAMLPLLDKGTKGLDEYNERANRFSKVTTDQVQAAAVAREANKTLSAGWTELTDTMGKHAGGALEAMVALRYELAAPFHDRGDKDLEEYKERLVNRYKAASKAELDKTDPKRRAEEAVKGLALRVTELNQATKEKLTLFGMDADAIALWKLQTDAAAASLDKLSKKKLEDIAADQRSLREKQRHRDGQKQLEQEVAALLGKQATPFEKFQDEVRDLDYYAALGELSWEQYAKAVDLAAEALDRVGGRQGIGPPPPLATFGSQAAASIIAGSGGSTPVEDKLGRLVRVAEEAKAADARSAQDIRAIADAVKHGKVKVLHLE